MKNFMKLVYIFLSINGLSLVHAMEKEENNLPVYFKNSTISNLLVTLDVSLGKYLRVVVPKDIIYIGRVSDLKQISYEMYGKTIGKIGIGKIVISADIRKELVTKEYKKFPFPIVIVDISLAYKPVIATTNNSTLLTASLKDLLQEELFKGSVVANFFKWFDVWIGRHKPAEAFLFPSLAARGDLLSILSGKSLIKLLDMDFDVKKQKEDEKIVVSPL